MEITREMYRLALHIYLIHAYPNDDEQYYSKWAYLAHPTWWDDFPHAEVRFGCHVSGNTKLRWRSELTGCSAGFVFDTNHSGDPEDVITEVKRIKKTVEDDWVKYGLPVVGRNAI